MFAHDSPALVGLFAATVAVWVAFEIRQSLRRRPESTGSDRGSQYVVRLAYVVAVVGAALVKRRLPSLDIDPRTAAAWIGLVVMWFGISLRIWSFLTLGRYFTFT